MIISRAARRVKVSSRIRCGSAPPSSSDATRALSVVGLAGPGAGEDQQGAAPVLGGEPLLGVQGVLAEHRSRLGPSTDGCTLGCRRGADGRRQTAELWVR